MTPGPRSMWRPRWPQWQRCSVTPRPEPKLKISLLFQPYFELTLEKTLLKWIQMGAWKEVLVVPGYGMAMARAQHPEL